eukprot:jgi/Hompol1/6807/HPOL_002293-RA
MSNFRKAYYSSLGVRTVEVKPSVENALQGEVLSTERLNKLCLWIRIPHFYRPIVWKRIGEEHLAATGRAASKNFTPKWNLARFTVLEAAANKVVHCELDSLLGSNC